MKTNPRLLLRPSVLFLLAMIPQTGENPGWIRMNGSLSWTAQAEKAPWEQNMVSIVAIQDFNWKDYRGWTNQAHDQEIQLRDSTGVVVADLTLRVQALSGGTLAGDSGLYLANVTAFPSRQHVLAGTMLRTEVRAMGPVEFGTTQASLAGVKIEVRLEARVRKERIQETHRYDIKATGEILEVAL